MTERTIVADEVTCPKCLRVHNATFSARRIYSRANILGMLRIGEHVLVVCKCGCNYSPKLVTKIESTEVPSE